MKNISTEYKKTNKCNNFMKYLKTTRFMSVENRFTSGNHTIKYVYLPFNYSGELFTRHLLDYKEWITMKFYKPTWNLFPVFMSTSKHFCFQLNTAMIHDRCLLSSCWKKNYIFLSLEEMILKLLFYIQILFTKRPSLFWQMK